jgi:hypothetical protein
MIEIASCNIALFGKHQSLHFLLSKERDQGNEQPVSSTTVDVGRL